MRFERLVRHRAPFVPQPVLADAVVEIAVESGAGIAGAHQRHAPRPRKGRAGRPHRHLQPGDGDIEHRVRVGSGCGFLRSRFAVEPFLEGRDPGIDVSERLVKRADRRVVRAQHELDLRRPGILEPFLGPAHQTPAKAVSLHIRIDRQIVDPAPMAVMAGHDAADRRAAELGNENFGVRRFSAASEVLDRIVPRPGQSRLVPQGGDGIEIVVGAGADPGENERVGHLRTGCDRRIRLRRPFAPGTVVDGNLPVAEQMQPERERTGRHA